MPLTTPTLIALATTAFLQPTHPSSKPPAAPPPATTPAAPVKVTITVNADDAPDLKEWGDKAKAICETWYPKIAEELKSDGFTPRDSVAIVFKKTMKVPAATGGGTISVNAEYVSKHQDDLGMMVHELTHAVQAYPRQKADLGWLTEGIADYIRFWKYEPQTKQRPIDKEKASYKNSYRISAAFLGWLAATHDKTIVTKLNALLRKGGADDSIFKDLLGASVDDLWKDFIAAGAPASPAALAKLAPAKDAVPPGVQPPEPPTPAVPADKRK